MDSKEYKDKLVKYTAEVTDTVLSFMPKCDDEHKLLFEAMEYSVANGGKRLRPLMIRESFMALGGCKDKLCYVYPFMAALEFIHSYSLVHDDLPDMDNDMYRRGKLTTHAKYGADIAILAGDGLLNLATETAAKAMVLAADNKDSVMMERTIRAFDVLMKKAGADGMIGGQIVDVANTGKLVGKKTLDFIYRLKTGALLEASLMIGAILQGRSEEEVKLMESVGTMTGLAFQIKDDILDETSTKEVLGKDIHSDADNNKVTYVTLYGIEESEKEVERLTNETIPAFEKLGIADTFLKELIMSLIHRDR